MEKLFLSPLIACSLFANPTDLKVVEGEAVCFERDHFLEVHTTDRAVLDWSSFSIQSNEVTKFFQPNSTSIVLNRVQNGDISMINGRLFANGIVYLVNPQGIVIGPQGLIETAAFIGSTLEIDKDHFFKNEPAWLVNPGSGSIVHLGTIEAKEGNVSLYARKIENCGKITAKNGIVELITGHELLLKPEGKSDLFLRPDPIQEGELSHSGYIEAIEAKLISSGPQSLVIGKQGVIEARHVTYEGGRILLRSGGALEQKGMVNVSGVPGGLVEMTGSTIIHEGTTLADGGGTISMKTEGMYLETQSSYLSALNDGRIQIEAKQGALCSGTQVGSAEFKNTKSFTFQNALFTPLENGNFLAADSQYLYIFNAPKTQLVATLNRSEFYPLIKNDTLATPILTITAGNDLLLNVDITNSGSDVTINAGNNLTLTTCLITNTNGNILALAGVDMTADATSGFKTTDATSTITLVADNSFPSSPLKGPGTFQFDPLTTICTNNCTATAGGFIQLYTSQTNPNVYPYFINTVEAPSASLQSLATYYPNGTEGVPYHIYYKGSEPVPVIPRQINVLETQGVAISEPLNQSTDTSESSVQQNTSTPDPAKACRIPNVSVKVGG